MPAVCNVETPLRVAHNKLVKTAVLFLKAVVHVPIQMADLKHIVVAIGVGFLD